MSLQKSGAHVPTLPQVLPGGFVFESGNFFTVKGKEVAHLPLHRRVDRRFLFRRLFPALFDGERFRIGTVQFWPPRAQRPRKAEYSALEIEKTAISLWSAIARSPFCKKWRRPSEVKENMKHQYFIFYFFFQLFRPGGAHFRAQKNSQLVHFSKNSGM